MGVVVPVALGVEVAVPLNVTSSWEILNPEVAGATVTDPLTHNGLVPGAPAVHLTPAHYYYPPFKQRYT